MNKAIFTFIRVLIWLYAAAYFCYFLIIGYQLIVAHPNSPQSSIPVLSVSTLSTNAKALEGRVALPDVTQYTASASGAFGRSEPFNP